MAAVRGRGMEKYHQGGWACFYVSDFSRRDYDWPAHGSFDRMHVLHATIFILPDWACPSMPNVKTSAPNAKSLGIVPNILCRSYAVKLGFAPEIVLCAAFAMAASSVMAIGQYIVENGGYHLFLYLENQGLIRRFAPHMPMKLDHFTLSNAWAVAGSHLPLYFVLCLFRRGFIDRVAPSFDPIAVWSFVWVTMILHDAWFFWLHTSIHWSKPAYRLLHQFHHQSTSDLNAFGTSYAEAAEFLFDWSLFYGCYTVLLYNLPSWNPIGLLLTFITVSFVNVMGHSGYDLPAWVYLPLSLGILGTPGSQRSRHHFIHHIDPRINRSLYFTWWDRIVGTFKDEHRMTSGKSQLDL